MLKISPSPFSQHAARASYWYLVMPVFASFIVPVTIQRCTRPCSCIANNNTFAYDWANQRHDLQASLTLSRINTFLNVLRYVRLTKIELHSALVTSTLVINPAGDNLILPLFGTIVIVWLQPVVYFNNFHFTSCFKYTYIPRATEAESISKWRRTTEFFCTSMSRDPIGTDDIRTPKSTPGDNILELCSYIVK